MRDEILKEIESYRSLDSNWGGEDEDEILSKTIENAKAFLENYLSTLETCCLDVEVSPLEDGEISIYIDSPIGCFQIDIDENGINDHAVIQKREDRGRGGTLIDICEEMIPSMIEWLLTGKLINETIPFSKKN